MKLGDLRDELANESGYTTGTSNYNTIIETWINDICRELFDMCKFLQYQTTPLPLSAGLSTYTISPNVVEIISIRYTDGTNKAITYAPPDALLETNKNWELASGYPEKYWVIEMGDDELNGSFIKIQVFPSPQSDLNTEVIARVTLDTLTEDDDIPFPRPFLSVIKDGVRMFISYDDGDYAGGDRWERKYEKGRERLIRKYRKHIAYSPTMRYTDIPAIPADELRPATLDWKVNNS